jgi:Zn-dependent peptidase ImmA (M78 family)
MRAEPSPSIVVARRTWPRAQNQHEAAAAAVLRRYAASTGWVAKLPIPVEQIIERSFGLSVVCVPIAETPGGITLGDLLPEQRVIRLNEHHMSLFETCIGPEAFTLAHELGHWLYDATDPNQQELFTSSDSGRIFCRRPDADLEEAANLREVNANKFASCLLMPADLLVERLPARFASWSELSNVAGELGVSRQAFEIRLQTLHQEGRLPT